MMNRSPHARIAVAVGLLALFAPRADAQIVKYAPPSTNSIILIDVNGLHRSALGQTENWAAKHLDEYAAGRAPFPATAQSVMFAREVDPNGLRAVRREVAVVQNAEAIGFQRLADTVGGKVQKIGDRNVVASPRGFLAALLDDKTAVGYFPSDRQAFGRWLKNLGRESSGLSPYLARAAASWPTGGQILVALDLAEGVDESTVYDELKTQKDVVKNDAQARALAKAFARLEGMRLSINVTDQINAEWVIEFTEPFTASQQVIRFFFEGAAKRMGASTFDLSKWSMDATATAVSFRSTLQPEQLRRILESIHSPILTGQALSRTGAPEPQRVDASRQYFQRVGNIVTSLDRLTDRMSDYDAAASEYDRSAALIQRMSTANVDPEVVAFGEAVATTLFNMSSSLRGVSREAAVQTAAAWNQRFFRGPAYYDPGWNYPWRWGVQPAAVVMPNPVDAAKEKVGRAMSDEAGQRRNDWLKIRELQRTTAANMSNKYGVDFTSLK